MQNSSQELGVTARRRAGGIVRPPTTQNPRRPIGAGGVSGGSRSGSLSVVTTHALFARKVQRKVSNGVAAFAARGSSLIGKNRGNFRVISVMQIDDQRLREDALREYFRRSRGLSAVRCVGKGDGGVVLVLQA